MLKTKTTKFRGKYKLKTMGGGRCAVVKRNPKQMAMCWPFLIMCLNCHQIITRQKAGGLKSELSGQVTVFFYNQD